MAIGNHSRITWPKSSALSTKKSLSSRARIEDMYFRGMPSSRRYAWVAPMYTPRCSVRWVATSSPLTRLNIWIVPLSSTKN